VVGQRERCAGGAKLTVVHLHIPCPGDVVSQK
jgi:hypothetical protein